MSRAYVTSKVRPEMGTITEIPLGCLVFSYGGCTLFSFLQLDF